MNQSSKRNMTKPPVLKTKEGPLQKAILEYLAFHPHLGYYWRSNQSTAFFDPKKGQWLKKKGTGYIDGVPDICGILPNGKWVGIECKSTDGKQSPAQMEFEIMVKRNNGYYWLVHSLDELQQYFRLAVPVVPKVNLNEIFY